MTRANRARSSHDSPKYGKHYTAEEVADIFAPAKDSVDAVFEWLRQKGVNGASLSTNKQWVQFDAPAENVEELLSTKYHIFEHEATGGSNIACDE